MSLPVSWHFVWQDQGTVVALSHVCSLCESWEVWTWGRWQKKRKKRKKEKKTSHIQEPGYQFLIQHGRHFTVVDDLVVYASSCCAVKVKISCVR